MITIGIIDDHRLLRQGLANLITGIDGFEVAFQAGSVSEAISCLERMSADVVLLDMALGDGTGMDVLDFIAGHGITARPLILTMHKETIMMEISEEQGARGYVLKDDTFEDLVEAVYCVMSGGFYMSSSIKTFRSNVEKTMDMLSKRELEIISMTAKGASAKETAEKLFISVRTVEKHKENIRQKLGNEKYNDLINSRKIFEI